MDNFKKQENMWNEKRKEQEEEEGSEEYRRLYDIARSAYIDQYLTSEELPAVQAIHKKKKYRSTKLLYMATRQLS